MGGKGEARVLVNILAMDSSTPACTVAALLDGECFELFETGENLHSSRMLPMVDEVLAHSSIALHDIDCIAVGVGPGSFTGLRIGVGIAQGLAYAANLPVVSVSSLAALAGARTDNRVLAGIDARMGEIYWACYRREQDGGMINLHGTERVSRPEDIQLPDRGPWFATGTAWDVYASELTEGVRKSVTLPVKMAYPHAADVARLGEIGYQDGLTLAAGELAPSYVRNDVARKSI
jgi:tRNA threonylcarbamoyladenosine biosynthesis protein TsaB